MLFVLFDYLQVPIILTSIDLQILKCLFILFLQTLSAQFCPIHYPNITTAPQSFILPTLKLFLRCLRKKYHPGMLSIAFRGEEGFFKSLTDDKLVVGGGDVGPVILDYACQLVKHRLNAEVFGHLLLNFTVALHLDHKISTFFQLQLLPKHFPNQVTPKITSPFISHCHSIPNTGTAAPQSKQAITQLVFVQSFC